MKTKIFSVGMVKSLRVALAILFVVLMTGYVAPANAIPEEVKQRVQEDLKGKCLEFFLNDKFVLFSPSELGYQYFATASALSLLDRVVFAFGETNSQQYCAYARYAWPNTTLEDAEERAIKSCETRRPSGGRPCEVYAHNNDIVYVSAREKLKAAKKLFEAGDAEANRAIAEVGEKGLSTLTPAERGEYEFLLGKISSNSNNEHDKTVAIGHFNNAWHKHNNVDGAVEEGNLRTAAGDIDKNWQPIRDAYQFFLANASDEQKARHPEVEQNLTLTEPYYQADLVQREATAKALAIEQQKQAKIDAIEAKRKAEQQAKQERLDAIRIANEERNREKARQAEAKRIAKEGDGSDDDKTCKSFGARPGSDGYINCRIQLSQKKQLADEQQAAQKESEAAAQRAKLAADFENNKRCGNETKNPVCYNNAGVALFYMGNKKHAQEWFTEAARYGEPNAISNLSRNGWPVPEPDLLKQQQQAKSDERAATALLLLLGGVNAYQQGKNSAYQEAPMPSYKPPEQPRQPIQTNCRADQMGNFNCTSR